MKKTLLSTLIMGLLITGCGSDHKTTSAPDINPDPPVSTTPTTPIAPTSPLFVFAGTWVEQGAGRALDISEDGISVYTYTRTTCAPWLAQTPLDEADNMFTLPQAEGEQEFSFLLNGAAEFDRMQFTKQASLPEACADVANLDANSPEFVFEHVWHNFNDYYPFFDLYDVNWQQQYAQYRDQVNAQTTTQQLFDLLSAMLAPLDDGHIRLIVQSDDLATHFSPETPVGWQKLAHAFAGRTNYDSNDLFAGVQETFSEQLFTLYAQRFGLDEYQSFSLSNEVELVRWGLLKDNVGYIQLNQMAGFIEQSDEQETLDNSQADLDAFIAVMDGIMAELSSADSLILDLRFNEGGHDLMSLALANYFADEPRVVLTKNNHNLGNPVQPQTFSITPTTEHNFTKPVYVITGPDTASAAEILAMSMQVLPHVTLTGENSNGALSDVLSVQINEQWTVGLSYQNYYNPDGEQYENVGITPALPVPVSSFQAVNFSAFAGIDHIYQDLELNSVGIDQDSFDEMIEDIMDEAGIPGLSVAWVDDQHIMAAQAFGYADIENDIANTTDTPFNLGSVSKTVLSVTVAQMMEQGLVDLDTSLADVGLAINSPYSNASDITLRHLVTHTSGIVDSSGYACAYYWVETQTSMYNDIEEEVICPHSSVAQDDFLQRYLTTDGDLYDLSNFIDYQPGEHYTYSNIAAALSAEVLTAVSGIAYPTWTADKLFNPLNMTATHWFNSDYSEDETQPAKRYAYQDDGLVELPEYALSTYSDGGLKSSANDMAKFLLGVVKQGSGQILTANSVNEMLKPQTTEYSAEGGEQGIFWFSDALMFGHSGGDPGASTQLRFDKSNQFGFILMINASDDFDELDSEDANKLEALESALNQIVYRRGLTLKREQ